MPPLPKSLHASRSGVMHALSILGFSATLSQPKNFTTLFSDHSKRCLPFESTVPLYPESYTCIAPPDKVVNFLVKALENADKHARFHSVNHAAHSFNFGTLLKLSEAELGELYYSSLLHDIGKVFFTELFTLPRKLTPAEYSEMQQHSIVSFVILSACDMPRLVSLSGLFHHLSFSKTQGYPTISKELVDQIAYTANAMDFPVPKWSLKDFMSVTEREWYLMSIIVLMDALDASIDPHRAYKTALTLAQVMDDFDSDSRYSWHNMFNPALKRTLEKYVSWLIPYSQQ